MKTVLNLTLLLHKLCNQRNVFDYVSNHKQVYLKLLLILLIFSSPNLIKANTVFNADNRDHYKISMSTGNNGNDGLNSVDVRLLVYDANGIDDYMPSADLYFYEDNGTLTKIATLGSAIGSNTAYCTPNNTTNSGYYVNWGGSQNSDGYLYLTGAWVYPQRLTGKNLKFRLHYRWDRDHDGIPSGTTNTGINATDASGNQVGDYDMSVQLPRYKVITTSLDYEPKVNNNVHFIYNINSSSSLINTMSFISNGATLKTFASPIVGSSKDTTINWSPNFNAATSITIRYSYTFSNFSNSYTPGCADKTYTYDSTFTNPGFKYPVNVVSTYNPSKQNINITWSAGNTTLGNDVKYYVKRGNTLLTPTPITGLSYTDPAFGQASTWNWNKYSYTVYSVSAKPNSRMASADSIPSLKTNFSVSTSPNIPNFKDFVLIPHPTNGTILPYMEVKWDSTQWSPQNNISNSTLKLYHRPSSTMTFSQYNLAANTQGYTDNTVTDNSKHFYKLEVNVFGQIFSQIDSETVVKKVVFKSIKATKNTVGDRIQLSWEIDRLDLCDRFEIYRSYSKDSSGIDINSTPQMVQQLSAQTVYTSWDDMTAAPGIVYQYYIKAYKTGLDGVLRWTLSKTDIGFRMPVGTVTGRITYGGGTAVGGVSLYVNSSNLDDNLLYKSMQFKGSSTQRGEVALTKVQHGCVKNGFTLQTWMLSSRPTMFSPIFEVSKEYSIGIRNDSVLAFIGTFDVNKPSLKCKLPSTVTENSYFHLSVSLGSNDSIKFYINGQKAAKGKLASHISTCSFADEVLDATTGSVVTARTKTYIANKTDNTQTKVGAYSGVIDDVRLWSTALADTIISGNYNHYLGGNETGLIGYWPLDEGINSRAFDCSKTDQNYNEHHINFYGANTSTYVPSQSQLSIKGVTDSDGSYIIRGIPFSGTGSTYSVQPVLGTHKFEPSQLVRYISPSSLVHNSSDFTDKSSFSVKVKVTYQNTTYPVEGVSFLVDQNPCVIESTIIVTDKTGVAILDVPIGQHYIKAQLNGHQFAYDGRYPAGLGKVDVTQAFGESTMAKGISFIDTTKVIVVGRVAGGIPQSNIPVGFGRKVTANTPVANRSAANIGQATIILQPTKYATLYSLNDTTVTKTLSSDSKRFASIASVLPGVDIINIKTDPITGEYMVKLPPIDWTVNKVTTIDKNNSTIDILNGSTPSFTTNPLFKNSDTLSIENKLDSFSYNVKRNFTFRVQPSIEVTDVTLGSQGAFGEKYYYVLNQLTGKNDTVILYDAKLNYKYSKPVFVMGKKYVFKIKAFERYFRSAKDSTDVSLSGASVTVENAMGKLIKSLDPADPANDSIPTHELTLNKNGFKYYEFLTGFPNLTTPSDGLPMNITLNYNNTDYEWSQNGSFSGIVLGSEPISGTNFVTQGPIIPLVVLRDPPGSNSYAYMETGTTLTYNVSSQTNFNQSSSGSATLKLGADVQYGIGFGFIKVEDAKWTNDTHIGFEQDFSRFTGTSTEKSLTLTERIQTSSSPDFVGSNADVYIGTSTNVLISQSNVLDIDRVAGQFVLNKSVQETSNTKAATEFRFSQNEILTAQIPMWKKKFPALFGNTVLTLAEFNAKKTGSSITTKNQYITYLDPSDPRYGMDKTTYAVLRPASNTKLHDEVDSIATQIRSWQNVISSNESTKYLARSNKNYDVTNISFDTGSSIERSYTYSDNTTTSSGKTSNGTGIIGTEGGLSYDGFGIGYSAEVKIGGGVQSGSESSTSKTTTFGYVLSDPDADNRFSVNVYRNKFLSTDLNGLKTDTLTAAYADNTLGSYIFQVAGGQTSCPYERIDSSMFYMNNNKLVQLGNGTQAIEAPFIRIKSNTKTDVPTGKDATYVLELSSNSIVPTSRAYMLSVDDASNKDGAIISIDGTPLTGGRLFYVAPGEILTKTLTLHQTKLDVLDYKGIKLQFSSPCDNSISVSQIINATYVPSCSDLTLTLDNQTLNTVTGSNLTLSMKDFNQEYKNFLGLSVEYKMEGETSWHGKVFAKNQRTKKLITNGADMLLPDSTSSSFAYSLSFDGLADGNYSIRAKTLCQDGINIINNITPEFTVVKDMVLPTAMGQPSPSNGILTPETEVSVTFNENIQTGKLVSDNFEVKGVLNGVALQHAEGLSLNGDSTSLAYTESPITLQNSSFSIEAWVRTASNCTTMGNIFTIGTGTDKVMLNMKRDAVEVSVNNQIIVSKSIVTALDWQYISLNYNANNKLIQVHLMSNSNGSSTIISTTLTNPVSPVGRLLVGKGFKGNINQVVVWNESRSILDLSDMNESKSGKETNIIGYWPMDEAYGTLAADKVRSRNMTVNSSWFVEPNGYSASFNGINQSLSIKTATIPLTNKDNFSLEFWFKGNAQTNKTIFSCGKGVGDINSTDKLSIGVNDAGGLIMNSKGTSYIIPSVNVLDGGWHHFAMSVLRNGNSNIYIDGQQKLQLSSSKIGGLASDMIALGSRRYADSTIVDSKKVLIVVQDQYFNGMLDEVRIWNSALGAENFRLDMRSKLTGTESGLIAYYPFEEMTKDTGGLLQITPSFNDCSTEKSGTGIYSNYLSSSYSTETPGIKVPRPKEDVSFSYTASDNKIIFNVDAPLAKIENCILEFAVNKVYDMNGNKLGSPIKWTAFVNNNRLNWETETVDITKQVLEAATFKATIVNNSGKYENYVIDGLPGWLSVDKSSGRLNPLQKTELNFTIDNSTNVGSYESRISLTGNNGIQELLPVSLKVTGPRPDWTVNPYDYESSMNITGQVQLEGVYQEDTEDILAAFIGTRCVGIASPQFNKTLNSYMVYMDVYGNSDVDTGLPVTFSLWDASTGRIYPGVDVIGGSIQFVSGAMLGTLTAPKTFNATDKVEQQLSIKKGWNWFSTNVVNTTPSLLDQVKTGMETDGLMIKSKSNGYIEYAGAWDGNLTTLNQKSMYLLKSGQTKTIKVVGATAKSADYPISIAPSWNWIGYIPQFVAPVQEALSGLTAKEGDQIKGQIGFATYSGGSWTGSLQYLVPGLGYMYFSNNTAVKTFVYPSQYLSMSKVKEYTLNKENMYWTYAENNYQSSMTVTGIAKIDNVEVANTNLQIGVFIDDVCRGAIELLYSTSKNRYFAYISVWGNASDLSKKITFKCYDPTSGKEIIAADKTLGFIPDNIVGSSANPFVINFSTTVTGELKNELNEQAIYPNPVVNTLYFNYDPKDIEQFEIVDCIGRTQVYSKVMNKNSVEVGNLVPGVYTLRVTYKGIPYVHRFIRK